MKIFIVSPGKAKFEFLWAKIFKGLLCLILLLSQENAVFAIFQNSENTFNQINSLETVNSFYARWCCANDGYIYGIDLKDRTVVLRKTEKGQAYQTRGSVAVLDPSFKIEDKIFSTTTPGLIFIPVKKSDVFFLLKSKDGGATFTNVHTFGEGNGPEGTNTPNVRLLRGILELTTEIPDGGGVGTLYIGEYNVCQTRSIGSTNDRVRIMKSVDNGDTWTKVVEWNTNGINQAGHVHAMKQDPYTGEIYICMGDGNSKAGIIKWDGSSEWADNKRLSEIGQMRGFRVFTGTQRYRVCDVLFDENYFYTFTDTQTPNNPTGSESGIWRGKKDFSSYTRMDNQIYEYDPMHIGWFGEKIGNTFIFTSSREYISPAYAWKELNTRVYISTDGQNWHASGLLNWRDSNDPATSRYIYNVFTHNNKLYIDCVGGAGHNSTIQCELTYNWKTYEDPVILHPVYFVGTWNAPGNDANQGISPDAPKKTLNNILTSSRISAGAKVKVAKGSFYETEINPDWSAALLQGRGSVVIEGQGMNETRIIRSSGSGTTYGIQIEASKTLTNSRTPFILKDLEIYLTVDVGGNHTNYVLSNVNSYIKTINCRIGNSSNDDSPLIKLSNEGSKYVSENSFHVANSGTGIYRNIVRSGASGTICHLKNCIILNGYDAFVIDYPGFDFSLKNCNLYAIDHAGVLFESTSDNHPVIKNCIFSCGEAPIISPFATTQTDIDYNLYNKALRNISDGGHSLIGTDPLFVDENNGDFNLRSDSPCSGTGIHLTDVLYDFASRARQNPPGIGAYESIFPSVKITQSEEISTDNPEIKKPKVKIYPNPVSGLLKIEYNDDKYKSIYILNTQGKLLKKEKVISPFQLIDFSEYEHGLYILEFDNPGGECIRVKVVRY